MKKEISFFIVILLPTVLYGQLNDIKVVWEPERKAVHGNKKRESVSFISNDKNEGSYYLIERTQYVYSTPYRTKRLIVHYDKNGKKINKVNITLKRQDLVRFFNGIYYNEGRMYLVYYEVRKKEKMNVLIVQKIDPETLKVDKNKRIIAEVPSYTGLFAYIYPFYLRMKNDKIYVLHAAPEMDSAQTKIGIYVLDLDFNLQWKHIHTFNYQKALFQLEDFIIDDNETITLLASIYKDKRIRYGIPNYKYHFFVFANKGNDFKKYSISLEDKNITDMKSGYLPNGDIACAGFYSNIGSSYKTNSIAGAFYITVDQESTNVKLQNYKAFDDDFLSRFMSERDVEKGHEIQNITLRNLHFLNDGSAILLAEEYSAHNELIALSFDDGYYTTSQVIGLINYWFDNIVIVKIDPDGIIKWADLILKKQHTREDAGQYSSFASAFIGDKIYLIYNDNPKNLTADPGSVYKFRKNSDAVTICAEINPDGNIKQKALFSAEESAVLIKPKACQQVENDMVIYGEKRKKCRWGLIEFPSN